MICKVYSADLCGVDAFKICVEADVSGGLPGFYMVGLPSSEVREAKERVERAVINSGFDFPSRKITINLSPAYLRKQGSGLDLPIALAVLAACGSVRTDVLNNTLFVGELSLDGTVNKIRGVLPIAAFARSCGFERIVVPQGNVIEGGAVNDIIVHGASNLKDLVGELNKNIVKDVEHLDLNLSIKKAESACDLDYSDVVGQENAKKATLTAVSGFHNLLYIGPPGAGKSMMAQRIPSIFDHMSESECLEISKIYSIAGLLQDDAPILTRPFRAPHQSITDTALLGGMSNPRPGEITLAHKGVLFLDELAEFKKNTIDKLRVPLEEKKIVITRAGARAVFPCDFMLVAATNPCKCGYYPDRRYCKCNEIEVARYLAKLKGPILDRIDICVGIDKVDSDSLQNTSAGMSSAQMRQKTETARAMQRERFKDCGIFFNSQMNKKQADLFCKLKGDALEILKKAYEKYNMTARGWYKILKVSRTIADTCGMGDITKEHVLEAISYRNNFLNM